MEPWGRQTLKRPICFLGLRRLYNCSTTTRFLNRDCFTDDLVTSVECCLQYYVDKGPKRKNEQRFELRGLLVLCRVVIFRLEQGITYQVQASTRIYEAHFE